VINPDLNISSNSNYAASTSGNRYFGTGMDQPPYFFTHNYYLYCTVMVWYGTCNSQEVFLSLGTAEYLDSTNWNTGAPSIAGTGNMFSAMLCHQRVYAWAAQHLFPDAVRPPYTSGVTTQYEESYPLANAADWQSHPASLVYSWDHPLPWLYTPPAGGIPGSVQTTPLAGCSNVQF
jgi:hypothetical protein